MSSKIPRTLRATTQESHFIFKQDAIEWVMKKSNGAANPTIAREFIDSLYCGSVLSGGYLYYLRGLLERKIAEFEFGS